MSIQDRLRPAAAIGCAVVAFVSSVAHADQKMEQIGSWEYRSTVNQIDDTKRYSASVWADDGQQDAVLVFKCDGGRKGAYVQYVTGKFMGVLTQQEAREVRYRLDKKPPISEHWLIAENSVVNLDKQKAEKFASRMMGASKVVMQALDYDFNSVQHTFMIDGATTALSKIIKDCGGSQLTVNNVPEPISKPAVHQNQQPTNSTKSKPTSVAKARELAPTLESRALNGDPAAQFKLGNSYLNGDGYPKDTIQALRWLTYAANNNHGPAQETIGVAYFYGWGVPADALTAKYWLIRASQSGIREAQFYLQQPELSLVSKEALDAAIQHASSPGANSIHFGIYGKIRPAR